MCVCVCVGQASGQMYTYPARCWRKKRRLLAPLDPQLRLCELRLGTKRICHSTPHACQKQSSRCRGECAFALHVVFMFHRASDELGGVSISYLSIWLWLASLPVPRSPGSFFPLNQCLLFMSTNTHTCTVLKHTHPRDLCLLSQKHQASLIICL